jgi:redox-sensitive bicupin YhaK (pirin superfamily)
MKKTIHKAESRGRADKDWLSTRYSFSFANWYDPTRMGFGALRVINDDTIAPDNGFSMHTHKDMEIITLVTSGVVTHRDSMGNTGTVGVGEIQVLSAGTGVAHAEYNNSKEVPLKLFQIWIEPRSKGLVPRYEQKAIPTTKDSATILVSPDGREGSLRITQEAYLSLVSLSEAKNIVYTIKKGGNGIYLFVISGVVEVDGLVLSARDAMGISDLDFNDNGSSSSVRIDSRGSCELLVIEVPI